MQLTSPAFANQAAIPTRHACNGEDLSATPGLPSRATKDELPRAVAGNVLATAKLTRVYRREAGR